MEVWSATYNKLTPASKFEASIMDEAHDLAEFCVNADDRTLCILVVSFLEDALKRVFAEQWKIISKKDFDRYFGGSGPLSTFSQRTLVAQGMQWLTPQDTSELDVLRRIRNSFAHNHHIHSIDDEMIRGSVETLQKREQVWCQREAYAKPYESAPTTKRLRLRVFCAGMFIISTCLAQAKLLQAQLPLGFRPGKGWDMMLEVERGLTDAAIRHCWRSLGLGYTGIVYEYRSKGPRPWEQLERANEATT